MINTKCPICHKGSSFTTCCGIDKETGKKATTLWNWIKSIINKHDRRK